MLRRLRTAAVATAAASQLRRLLWGAPQHSWRVGCSRTHCCAAAAAAAAAAWPPQQLAAQQRHLQQRQHQLQAHQRQPARGLVAARSTAGPAPEQGIDTPAAVRRLYEAAELRVSQALQLADVGGARARLAALQHDAASDSIWDDTARAQQLLSEIASLETELAELNSFSELLDDAAFCLELAAVSASELEVASNSSSSSSNSSNGSNGGGSSRSSASSEQELASLLSQARAALGQLAAALDKWDMRMLLSGPYDEAGALLTISAGAGGVDAMDWAEMLERMYTRWAADHAYALTVTERTPGEEAGVKSVELAVRGKWAYGYLKGEKGTHRLVRSSPFNAKGLRQTSFAGVEVLPLLEGQAEAAKQKLVIPDKDLELSFMRSGGKGGQNVNKVESGVRLVHTPTGMAVKCTEHRTQQQNRATALERLTAKLLVVLEEQQAAALADIRGDVVKAQWGQQIRNYVLHPYKLVKDTRTGYESNDVSAVMDGASLDDFITAYLRHQGRAQQEARLTAPTA